MKDKTVEFYSLDVKLNGQSQFAQDWNKVSDLFQKWKETDSKEDWDNYFDAKYRLEQGMPV